MQVGNLICLGSEQDVETSCLAASKITFDSQPMNAFQRRELNEAIDATLQSLDKLFGQIA